MSSHATMAIPDTTQVPAKPRVMGALSWIALASGIAVIAILVYQTLAHPEHHAAEHHDAPALWGIGILPFCGILGGIAILPLLPATHHWWESNQNRLAVALAGSGLTILYYILVRGVDSVATVLEHAIVAEYIPFIVLLFSLYVISGGISLRGDLAAHPSTNTAFLAIGAGIASFIGTTGASMLLIRPLLNTNSERKHVVHTVVFFIFLVSNIGGTLLPIGDPPLFLGYLYGVPFFWTFNLWIEWLFCCVILLVIYFIWDSIVYRREEPSDIRRDETVHRPLRLRGWINFLWLGLVVVTVAFVNDKQPLPGTNWTPFPFLREVLMLGIVGLSLATTPRGVREDNRFNYAAILEVAALFVGIFIAMQVPIEVLRAKGDFLTSEYITEPWHFFWATGSLSAFLDNAPTYVVFFQLGKQSTAFPPEMMLTLTTAGTIAIPLLVAVSLGSVFMGAMTYIGNGPNFMVKAIAEQAGVRMPSFFGYMFKYSIPILIPVFVIVTVVFVSSGMKDGQQELTENLEPAAAIEPTNPAQH